MLPKYTFRVWAASKIFLIALRNTVVDRIEAMADGAVVVGTDGKNLHFTPIKLGDSPEVADDYTRAGVLRR